MGSGPKRILVAPLDWGLGHATRCIPVIRYLLEKDVRVTIAADGRPLFLLQKEFPSLDFISLPGYDISYARYGSMALKMATQVPKILAGIKREHSLMGNIIRENKFDGIISDNRFGLWSRDVPSVFITHQVMVKSPFGEKFLHGLNKKYISKFSECWVPDMAGEGLSGDLAHKFPLPENARYIGLLSRFKSGRPPMIRHKRKLLAVLSGPEPQRTAFEEKIIRQASAITGLEVLIVRGITEVDERRRITDTVEMVSHLTSGELEKEILNSGIVLARPGYSTVMDLAIMGKKAIFVPTPGQTEQEYLGKFFSIRKVAYYVAQNRFDLEAGLKESGNYSGFTGTFFGEEFKGAVDSFLAGI